MQLQKDSWGYAVTISLLSPSGGPLDLTTVTALEERIQYPDRAPLVRQLALSVIQTPATSGIIAVPVLQGDLPSLGFHNLQIVDKTTGRFIPTKVNGFLVSDNLPIS